MVGIARLRILRFSYLYQRKNWSIEISRPNLTLWPLFLYTTFRQSNGKINIFFFSFINYKYIIYYIRYEAGRTESIRDNLNPEWATKIEIDYFFEEEQKLRIEVYDKDSSRNELKNFKNYLHYLDYRARQRGG